MRRMPIAAYFWPGLPQVCRHGSWFALGVAVAAAAGLNFAVACTLGWTELIGPDVRTALWVVLGIVWVGGAGYSALSGGPPPTLESADGAGDGFAEAARLYLEGNYVQAEQILEDLLSREQRDVDARLMLATLMRHAGRTDEATGQLDLLEKLDGAEKWELEIQRERGLLAARQDDSEPQQLPIEELEANTPPAERTHAA